MAGPTSVLFLGMQASFSTPVLAALIAARMEICGVLIPASDEPLPKPLAHSDAEPVAESGLRRLLPLPSPSVGGGLQILTPFVRPGVVQLAWEAGIPVYEARSLAAGDVLARVRELRPDVMAVACWPGLIPRAFSALAGLAALNVHPSLLPDNRGPAPLFWTFRLGRRTTGVSVHELSSQADAGPLLGQHRLRVAEGIEGETLERRCAETGGALLVRAIRELATGRAHPRAQDGRRATSHPLPAADDFLIPSSWPARRAFNFIRGVAHMQGPLRVDAVERTFYVRQAISYDEAVAPDCPYELDGVLLRVRLNPGTLTVEVTADSSD